MSDTKENPETVLIGPYRVTPEFAERLNREAKRDQRSQANVVRLAIQRYLEEKERGYDGVKL